jgi:cystathionine beta-lyase/cystathionine gamma-synthase
MTDDKPETKIIAGGRKSGDHFGAVNTPIYRASTMLYPDLAAIKANTQPYTYGRREHPAPKASRRRFPTSKAPPDRQRHLRRPGDRIGDPVGLQRGRSSVDGGQLL